MKIRILFPGPFDPAHPLRRLEDLLPFQDPGVELSLACNTIGPAHCQSTIENTLGAAGMASVAVEAEQAGIDAIVIESMGDTGLIECREAVKIPVIGMSDVTFRLAAMQGRRFGLITAGTWHAYAIERLIHAYHLSHCYAGYKALDLQPFFSDANDENQLDKTILEASIELIHRDCDTIVFGGSYFLGRDQRLQEQLAQAGYPNRIILDPLPLAIRFAAFQVHASLAHSKILYPQPTEPRKVIGYPSIPTLPGGARD